MGPSLNPLGKKDPIHVQMAHQQQVASPETLNTSVTSMIATAKEEAMVVDKELAHIGKEISDTFKKKEPAHNQADPKTIGKGKAPEELVMMLDALLSSLNSDKKTRKKKTPLDEKLETLATLEGNIDLSQLPEEEQKEFKKFFDNMSRVKQMKSKLKQLEYEEDELEERLALERKKHPNQQPSEHPSITEATPSMDDIPKDLPHG